MLATVRSALIGIAAVLGVACTPDPGREGRSQLPQRVPVPEVVDAPLTAGVGRDIGLPPEVQTLVARVSAGATLASLLSAHDVAEREVAALVARVADVFDVRRLRSDRPYRIVQAIGGALRRFEYEIDSDRVLTVARSDKDDFVAAIDPITKRTELGAVAGAIDRETPSLFAAIARTGEGVDLAVALAEALSSEVDFNTELQPGDRFRVSFEKQFRDDPLAGAWHTEEMPVGAGEDRFAGYGAIQGAELVNAGRTIRAIRFTPSGGSPQLYDERGRSLRRFLLKSPLKFDPVVTSPFSKRRLHPVLGFHRAHLGVDYRAAVGAPVVAVADGTVVFAGFNGGAGRMVHLRHANGLETQYLHLSAANVRAGARVRQGEVIGKVGATGLATGPHLDYRVRKDGTFVDPAAVHRAMPPGEPLPEGDRIAFEAARDRILATLPPN